MTDRQGVRDTQTDRKINRVTKRQADRDTKTNRERQTNK